MKILHFDFDDLKNPNGGGQAVRTFEINRRLAKRHQIMVVTGNYVGAKNEVIEGINYIRIGLKSFPWNFLSFIWTIPEIVKKQDFDLVVENFTPPFGPALTPLFTKKPVIAMVDWAFARQMSKKYKLPFFLWQDLGIKLYENYIFPTQAIEKYLIGESDASRNILISQNGPSSEFKPLKKKMKNYILFMGRLDCHQKGIDMLLRAYNKIVDELNVPLYLAGDGRDRLKIQKTIDSLRLSNKVKMLGKISGQEKRTLLAEARIVCITSRYEAGPVAVYESLAFQKTIVAFDTPVLKEATQNQAIFAQAFDVQDLAEKILFAYQNAEKLSVKIKIKSSLNWDETAEIQENFYLKVFKK